MVCLFLSPLFHFLFILCFLGSLNPDEDGTQARDYLRNYRRLPSQPKFTNSPRLSKQQSVIDDLARHYMYTSTQQAAFDEVAWGKKKKDLFN